MGKDIQITINGKPLTVQDGTSVLDAARKAGFEIPTLCHLEGQPGFSSCMLCTVEDKATGKTFPSCAINAAEGMDIETENDALIEKRKGLLELIMSEHLGDCEAPCELVCPAHIPIPQIIRLLRNGKEEEAAMLLRERVPLAGVLERICTAPCEKGCRRSQVDDGVFIRSICRYAADLPKPHKTSAAAPDLGKKVGIVGAGAAGLSAAFYLSKAGVDCTIIDEHDEPGGMIRYAVPESKLPRDVLEAEIELLKSEKIHFDLGKRVGTDIDFEQWRQSFDAVIVCAGQISDPDNLPANLKKRDPHPSPLHPDQAASLFGLEASTSGLKIEKGTMKTSIEGVFAGGDSARFHRMAVRAVGDGRKLAASVLQFLKAEPISGEHELFNCSMGRLSKEQLDAFAKRAIPDGRLSFEQKPSEALPLDAVVQEAKRCMACDCVARDDCDLRDYSDQYNIKANSYKALTEVPFIEDESHSVIVHEQGKCIRCSICIRLSAVKNETVGLAAMGRGAEKHPSPPTGHSWSETCNNNPEHYTEQCPTGALSKKRE